jgi:DNA-binding beta-propeller fold protein YncE
MVPFASLDRLRTGRAAAIVIFALLAAMPARTQVAPIPKVVAIPDGEHGLGFDDIGYSAALGRVVIPSASTGAINLIDPPSLAIEAIPIFAAAPVARRGHGEGVTSADAANGYIFATDRTSRKLGVINLSSRKMVASAALAGGPDYVRFVAPTHEIWVTEPRDHRIEIFSLDRKMTPVHATFIDIPGGPESLMIDSAAGRAYANLWTDSTLAIDLKERKEVARWKNGCKGSRGLAFDAARNFLFVGCSEGKLQVLDPPSGKNLGEASSGVGVDIIAYNPNLSHLYLPGARSATMATIEISASGAAKVLGQVATAKGAHCAAADESNHVYVCDPHGGRILVFTDSSK